MLFTAGQKVVFIGDGITDSGRRDRAIPFGNGYVGMIRNLLVGRYPELKLTIVNRGIDGNTVADLAERWEQDAVGERPNWLSVHIGINDVWRAFGRHPHQAVPVGEYETILRRLLDRAKQATGTELILMTPYVIRADRTEPARQTMDSYGAVVARLAADYGATLVDTQAAFDQALQHSTPGDLARTQIHPVGPGHALLALAFLRAIGFEL